MLLETSVCKIKLSNPTVLASGFISITSDLLKAAVSAGAGAVTTKSIGKRERRGHRNPVVVSFEYGIMNAVGLPCPGIEKSLEELEEAVKKVPAPVIASFFAETPREFGELAGILSKAKPAMLEANISCPNVATGQQFAFSPESAAEVVKQIKDSTSIPLSVKLSPNTHLLVEVAKAVEKAGADAITAINSVGPGMLIDIESAKPVLSFKTGGVSGPAIRPIAVGCVYRIYEAVGIPIIGVGGVMNGRDAIEMLMAGASAVGIGTAIRYRGIGIFSLVAKEIAHFMKTNGYSSIKELSGLAHK